MVGLVLPSAGKMPSARMHCSLFKEHTSCVLPDRSWLPGYVAQAAAGIACAEMSSSCHPIASLSKVLMKRCSHSCCDGTVAFSSTLEEGRLLGAGSSRASAWGALEDAPRSTDSALGPLRPILTRQLVHLCLSWLLILSAPRHVDAHGEDFPL